MNIFSLLYPRLSNGFYWLLESGFIVASQANPAIPFRMNGVCELVSVCVCVRVCCFKKIILTQAIIFDQLFDTICSIPVKLQAIVFDFTPTC